MSRDGGAGCKTGNRTAVRSRHSPPAAGLGPDHGPVYYMEIHCGCPIIL